MIAADRHFLIFDAEGAIDATLVSRSCQRYADHPVNAAHDLIFLVTGNSERRPLVLG